jgi:hypothetical protein
MLVHQPADFLVIDDHPSMAQLGANSPLERSDIGLNRVGGIPESALF